MTSPPELVILSGGAESVSVAVAEVAWRARISYAVVSLLPKSLLHGAPGCVSCVSIWSKGFTPEVAGARLVEQLGDLQAKAGCLLPVLPTEDDGLRLLNESVSRLADGVTFSRACALRMGGLDKAELFDALGQLGLHDLAAPTRGLDSVDDLDEALDALGDDAIIKPAFKPWGCSLGRAGLKVVTRVSPGQSRSDLRRQLSRNWHLASRWVAQKKLLPLDGGERSACIVRSRVVRGCEVIERLKYPRMGGSAVVVDSSSGRGLLPMASQIAEALDIRGMCEMSFLADEAGRPRLLELNTRPWLQVELVEKSGYPIIEETLRALAGKALVADDRCVSERRWIHLERLILCWLSGDAGPRHRMLLELVRTLRERPVVAVYGSRLPGVRGKWLARNVRKLVSGLAVRR